MKRKELSQAISGIRIRYVQEAEDYTAGAKRRKRTGNRSKKCIAAAAAICIFGCAVMMCIPSAARSFKGYFQDLFRWDGTVTGLEYQAGAAEIKIGISDVVCENGKLVLSVQIKLPDTNEPPFTPRYMSKIALGNYSITDASGREIWAASGRQEDTAGTLDRQTAALRLSLEQKTFPPGAYVLVIASVYGLEKTEQPLEINGYWKCPFVVEDTCTPPS